jgi:hypothetical protein
MAVVLNHRRPCLALSCITLCMGLAACGSEEDPDFDGLADAALPVTIPDGGLASDAALADATAPRPDSGITLPLPEAGVSLPDAAQLDANVPIHDAGLDAASDASPGDALVPSDARTPDASGDGGASCATLTYQSFGQQFLTTNCTSCHTGTRAQRGILLDTLAGVQTNKAAIRRQAVTGTSMPPRTAATKPSAADRQKLGQWLDCGPN